MMCCNECPFHPTLGSALERCSSPVCSSAGHACRDGFCALSVRERCFQDRFVITRLYQEHPLAIKLAEHTFDTACLRRDRSLLLSLLHAATHELRQKLWKRLHGFQPRILWMLNPVFAAAGLSPVPSLTGLGAREEQYRKALFDNPYAGRFLFPADREPPQPWETEKTGRLAPARPAHAAVSAF
ncbi:MAG TPA: hypothetical protein PKM25_02275 [Candidatus Ozemobacteraceae bacterium]|nr:hypothetical protein [Candidatus Ozemobacteraceae bacterium]